MGEMLWVLAGTKDGEEVIRLCKAAGYMVLATAVTEYGASLAREAGADRALAGALGEDEMVRLMEREGIKAVIDATHPFAAEASRTAMEACRRAGTRYLRFERSGGEIPSSPLIEMVRDFGEAAERATKYGTIFFAAGVRNLEAFLQGVKGRRVVARVLPSIESIERCLRMGVRQEDIVAMQGPFSRGLNREMLRHFGAEALVTKESGRVGGLEEKIQAALDLGIKVILVERPPVEYGEIVNEYPKVLEWLRERKI